MTLLSNSLLSSPPKSHASRHVVGGLDEISNLNASQVVSDTFSDNRLSSNIALLSNVLPNRNQNSSSIDVCERIFALTGPSLISGQVFTTFFTPCISLTVSQITVQTFDAAASGITLARMGLYTFSGSTMTLVARTANDTSLFSNINTFYTRSFDTTGGYPAAFDLQAGTRYGVALICVGSNMPRLYGPSFPFEICSLSPQLSSARSSQSDLFASWNSVTGSSSFQVWAKLS